MPIKDYKGKGRVPRLGKIRLGVIKKGKNSEYPSAVDYFVCPKEVKKVYGPKPKKLEITFHSDKIEEIFPQYYKRYGKSTGLVCKGDGESALAINPDTGEFGEIECAGRDCDYYKNNQCKEIGNFYFMILGVKRFGVYQLDTSSYNSILNINGGIEFAQNLTGGRLKMIPFILEVRPQEVNPEGKKKTVYVLHLEADIPKMQKALASNSNEILQLEKPRIPEKKDIEDNLYPESVVETLKATEKQLKRMWAMVHEAGIEQKKFKSYLINKYEINSSKELTRKEIEEVFKYLEGKTKEAKDGKKDSGDQEELSEEDQRELEKKL